MDIFSKIGEDLYFNYYTFGSLVTCIFTILQGVFLLALKNKSKSTTHIGLSFTLMGFFNFSYVFAAAYYNPIAAYHRWISVGLILPAILHFAQWTLRFPEFDRPKFTRGLLFFQYSLAIIITSLFIKVSLGSDYKFHFTGHYWDFDAEKISKVVGAVIFAYIATFIVLGVWKSVVLKTSDRWVVLFITIALSVAAITPALMNLMSRDGSIDRGVFLTTFVFLTVLGFFMVVIIYINNTKDKTTFMAKIVGTSLVTFLLLLQVTSYFSLQDRELEYDALRAEMVERAIDEVERNTDGSILETDPEAAYKNAKLRKSSINEDIQYILAYHQDEQEIHFAYSKEDLDLETKYAEQFKVAKPDFYNAGYFDDINNIIKTTSDDQVHQKLESYIRDTKNPPEFDGFKDSIMTEFVEKYSNLDGDAYRKEFDKFIKKLNKDVFVASNKVRNIKESDFCSSKKDVLGNLSKLASFKAKAEELIASCPNEEQLKEFSSEKVAEINKSTRNSVLTKLVPMQETMTRHYRRFNIPVKKYSDYKANKADASHFTGFFNHNKERKVIYEVGFSYVNYRAYIHPAAKVQIIILLCGIAVFLIVFPLFFKGSLVNPLNDLLSGVEKVNLGNLEVQVPVKVQDEIGFLAGSFNHMVSSIRDARRELQDYAENLEERVKERTKEVQEKMEEVQALKVHQDGDYYLTSLLTKPLFFNANKSKKINTEFLIKQKKSFEFRNKKADLGGDICVSGNLKFGTADNFKQFTMAMNGDAMGKSMQGAGGSLVMGVMMNSIMARSASNKRILHTTPEKWMTEVYEELNSTFKAFNGSMVISATVFLIDDETGEAFYWNAEHPFSVLYRDGKASFIENDLQLRKLGLESEIPFVVKKIQLHPGDVIILASDGRDDIDLTPDEDIRTINEDEMIFLENVEKGNGNIEKIKEHVMAMGEITDDLSFLRIAFKENYVPEDNSKPIEVSSINAMEPEDSNLGRGPQPTVDSQSEKAYEEGRKLYRENKPQDAIQVLYESFKKESSDQKRNKLLALLAYKEKDYKKAVEVLNVYLKAEKNDEDFWYYLSVSQKKVGNYKEALEAGKELHKLNDKNLSNLVNVADLSRIVGDYNIAKDFINKAQEIDPDNKNVIKLQRLLSV